MDNLRKLKETLAQKGKANVPVVTAWCVVKEVDWEDKTMTATGVMDGLDYNEVLLGIGNVYKKPKPGAKCLIGLIENNPAASFLIECESVELYSINVDGQLMEMDGDKFLFKNGTESFAKLMADTLDSMLTEKHMTNTGVTISLTPDSTLKYEQLKTRFNAFLKDS